jgi:nucleotide-binding universal stress UspA family protein
MSFPEEPLTMSAAGVKRFTESAQPSETVPSVDIKKILIPTDFPQNAAKALRYAVQLGRRTNSSVILIHVFELPEFVRQLPSDYSYASHDDTIKQLDAAKQRCAEKLESVARNVRESNMKVKTLQRLGIPYEEIVHARKELPADVIVIATHGYTAVKALLARKHYGKGGSPCALSGAGGA